MMSDYLIKLILSAPAAHSNLRTPRLHTTLAAADGWLAAAYQILCTTKPAYQLG
jgi:hypothetical protein